MSVLVTLINKIDYLYLKNKAAMHDFFFVGSK